MMKKVKQPNYPKGKNPVIAGDMKILGENFPHVHGVFKRLRYNEGKFGKRPVFDIETDDGLLAIVGGTILNNKMSGVKPGKKVYLTWTGTAKSGKGKNPMALYDVSTD